MCIIVGSVFVAVFWAAVHLIGPNLLFYIFLLMGALQVAIGLLVSFVYLISGLSFRRVLFSIGATLFLLTRAVLFWIHLGMAG